MIPPSAFGKRLIDLIFTRMPTYGFNLHTVSDVGDDEYDEGTPVRSASEAWAILNSCEECMVWFKRDNQPYKWGIYLVPSNVHDVVADVMGGGDYATPFAKVVAESIMDSHMAAA